MRFSVFLAGMFLAGGAQAHVGHLADVAAGHDHWVAAGAIGIAIAVAGWQALKGKKDAEVEEDPSGEETAQEA